MKVLVYYLGSLSENEGVGNVALNIGKRLSGVDLSYLTVGKLRKFLFYSFLSPCWFALKVRKVRPDIVFVHTLEASMDPIVARSIFGFKYKVLVLVHGDNKTVLEAYLSEAKKGNVKRNFNFELNLFVSNLRSSFIASADKIVAISRSVQEEIAKNHGVKSVVIPNGYSGNLCRPAKKIDFGEILFVGNSYWRKGLHYLIIANNSLSKSRRITVVGLNEAQQKQLMELVDCSRVTFIKFLPHGEMLKRYSRATLFAMPSVYESFGLVYLEALSCGVPVVASKLTGAEDIIIEGKNGALAKIADSSSIAQAILRAEKIRGHVQKIDKKFLWENVSKRYLALFKSLQS